MNPLPILFFIVFALVLLGGYVAIRRRLASVPLLGVLMTGACVIAMFLVSVTNGDSLPQAVFVGLLVGGVFSMIVLVVANYFSKAETRSQPPPSP
jgi:Na+/H+-translocating membrane pyrophosphatase